MNNHPRFLLQGREQEVADAYIGGKSTTQVGKMFGVSHASVVQVLCKLGVSRRTRSAAAMRTHCKRGHLLEGDNLYWSPKGVRSCHRCRKETPHRVKYGMPSGDFDNKLKAQAGRCATCSEPMNPPCVDHDHATNEVRDLLCRACNSALGQVNDSIDRLHSLVAYLKKWKPNASTQ